MALSLVHDSSRVVEWEGRAQIAVGMFIERYLADHPCPGPSSHYDAWREWASNLRAHGENDLSRNSRPPRAGA